MVMGIPAAGKSTLTRQFVADGYLRLNRDESGGTLRGLLPELRRALQGGAPRIVLDNTYVTRTSRAEVIQAAAELGVQVRCVWLNTGIDDAQVNAVTRLDRTLRPPARRPRTEAATKDRRRRLPALGVVPLSARPRATRPVRGLLEHRAGAVHARGQSRTRQSRGDRLVRRAVATRGPRARPARTSGWRLDDLRAVVASRDRGRARAATRTCGRRLPPSAIAPACVSTSTSARTAPARRAAGAASRCPASAWPSSIAMRSIQRSACSSAMGRRTPGSRASSAFDTLPTLTASP